MTSLNTTLSPGTNGATTTEVTLPINGMTCASCVRRVEKALGKATGVPPQTSTWRPRRRRSAMTRPLPPSTPSARPSRRQATASARSVVRHLPPAPQPVTGEVMLPIEGMTCASLRAPGREGAGEGPGRREANVNLATEKATVSFDPAAVDLRSAAAAVEKAGYAVGADRRLAAPAATVDRARGWRASTSARSRASARSPTSSASRWSAWRSGSAMMALMYLPLGRRAWTLLAPVAADRRDGRPVLGRAGLLPARPGRPRSTAAPT